jgi:hypothetical protein
MRIRDRGPVFAVLLAFNLSMWLVVIPLQLVKVLH